MEPSESRFRRSEAENERGAGKIAGTNHCSTLDLLLPFLFVMPGARRSIGQLLHVIVASATKVSPDRTNARFRLLSESIGVPSPLPPVRSSCQNPPSAHLLFGFLLDLCRGVPRRILQQEQQPFEVLLVKSAAFRLMQY